MAVTTVTSGLNQEKGITYTVITDSSADWGSVSNDTYFYDLGDGLPHYKDATGTVISIFESGGGDSIYTADGTLTGNRILTVATNTLTFDGSSSASNDVFDIIGKTSGYAKFNNGAGLNISSGISYHLRVTDQLFGYGTVFNIDTGLGGYWKSPSLTLGGTASRIGFKILNGQDYEFYNSANARDVFYDLNTGTKQLLFLEQGFVRASGSVIFGGSSVIGSEDISLQGETVIKGENTLSTDTALAIYDGDGTPNKLWDFRNNGDIHTGQDNFIYFEDEITVLTQSDLNTKFRISNGDDKQSRLFVGGNSGAFQGLQLQYFGNNTAVPANMRGKQALYGEFGHGELIISNNATNEDAEIWFNIGRGATDDWDINRRRAKITKDDFKIHNVSGLIYHPTNDDPTKIGTENVSLQGSVLIDGTLDMNNNRITNAVVNPSVQETTSTATFTINADEQTDGVLTAMAAATTIAAPTGSPVQSQNLIFRFKDNGTARALTWNAIFRAIGVTLPTTTTANKTLYVGCKYNSTDTKWDVIAVKEEA